MCVFCLGSTNNSLCDLELTYSKPLLSHLDNRISSVLLGLSNML